jgi:hypothetical protein
MIASKNSTWPDIIIDMMEMLIMVKPFINLCKALGGRTRMKMATAINRKL